MPVREPVFDQATLARIAEDRAIHGHVSALRYRDRIVLCAPLRAAGRTFEPGTVLVVDGRSANEVLLTDEPRIDAPRTTFAVTFRELAAVPFEHKSPPDDEPPF